MSEQGLTKVLIIAGIILILGCGISEFGWFPITTGSLIVIATIALQQALKLSIGHYQEENEKLEKKNKDLKSQKDNLEDHLIKTLDQLHVSEKTNEHLKQRLKDVERFFKELKPETQEMIINYFDPDPKKEGEDVV